MTGAKIRLAIALVLFAGWVGWIGYLAVTYRHYPVVSHAQLLVASIDVIADIDAEPGGRPKEHVKIDEVLWPANSTVLKPGQDIEIKNIASTFGFAGSGTYLLPLVKNEQGGFLVASLPHTGEFARPVATMYPANREVRRQEEAFRKPG